MTALLDQALTKVARLPNERQDELARMLLTAAGCDDATVSLTPEQVAEIEKRLQDQDDTLSIGEVRAQIASWAK